MENSAAAAAEFSVLNLGSWYVMVASKIQNSTAAAAEFSIWILVVNCFYTLWTIDQPWKIIESDWSIVHNTSPVNFIRTKNSILTKMIVKKKQQFIENE